MKRDERPQKRDERPQQTRDARGRWQSGRVLLARRPRGPDLIPRKQILASLALTALYEPQLRDPQTGRLTPGGKNLVRAAGMRDLMRAHARLLYALAHGDELRASALATAVTRTADYFRDLLDDTGRQGAGATFVLHPDASPGASPDSPTDYEEVREEDAR